MRLVTNTQVLTVDMPPRNLASKYVYGIIHMSNGMEDVPSTLGRMCNWSQIRPRKQETLTAQCNSKHRGSRMVGFYIGYFLNL
jgi:hypothetical protein